MKRRTAYAVVLGACCLAGAVYAGDAKPVKSAAQTPTNTTADTQAAHGHSLHKSDLIDPSLDHHPSVQQKEYQRG